MFSWTEERILLAKLLAKVLAFGIFVFEVHDFFVADTFSRD